MRAKDVLKIIMFGIYIAFVISLAIGAARPRFKKNQTIIIREKPITDSLISQNKMQEIYGWNKIILWIESKENFEKAYHTKLYWINYPMEFVKHPECIDPFGGSSEWRDDKLCFYYRFPSGKPEIPNLIAKESRGKTLVIIGSLYDNGKRFSGGVYWCE